MNPPSHNLPVLITGSEPGAGLFADRLQKKGVKTITQPLISINLLTFTLPDLSAYNALIFTSRHGAMSVRDQIPEASIPAYTVGDRTAEAAVNMGFDKVISAGGTLNDLIQKLEEDFGPLSNKEPQNRFLYIRGRHVSGSIPCAEEIITYEAVANPELSKLAQEAIRNGRIAAVTLFSARTARIYRQTLERYSLLEEAKRIPLLSISDSVLECVQDFIHTYSANAPTIDAMEELVLHHLGISVK